MSADCHAYLRSRLSVVASLQLCSECGERLPWAYYCTICLGFLCSICGSYPVVREKHEQEQCGD